MYASSQYYIEDSDILGRYTVLPHYSVTPEPLEMKELRSSETSVSFNTASHYKIPED
jgi:hypothetical protein